MKQIISKSAKIAKKLFIARKKAISKSRLDKTIINVLTQSVELQQMGQLTFNKKGREIVLQNVFHTKEHTSVNIYFYVTLDANTLPSFNLLTIDLNGKAVNLTSLHNSVLHIIGRRYKTLVEYLLSSISDEKIKKMEALEEQGIDGVIHLSNNIKF